MFPPSERFHAVYRAITPVLRMALAGERGLFNARKRNASLLATYLLDARRHKDRWQSTGDYFFCKRAHIALLRATRAAMKGAGLGIVRENEVTVLIVYSLLEAGICRRDEHPLAAVGDVQELAQELLRRMWEAGKELQGIDILAPVPPVHHAAAHST